MRKVNLHTHTIFCDGKNTAEEMVLSAISKGFDVLGFSGHSFTSFDGGGCIKDADIPAYKSEIARLKKKYKDKILILCGLEQDYYATQEAFGYDYTIGSVHAYHVTGPLDDGSGFAFIDYSTDHLRMAADKFYNGDLMAVAEGYFDRVSTIVEKTNCNIIGHFDIISKFNEKELVFDENDPRYVAACDKALEKLIASGAIFEINTGAMAKGWRTTPYPSAAILRKICQSGGRIIISSDSHAVDTIDYGFEQALRLAKDCGFKTVVTVDDNGRFVDEEIVI